MAQVPALLAAGVSCFDLSADYRLSDPSVFEAWYAAGHTSPELLKTRAFGLPELFCQDLETAASSHAAGKPVLVACAGCYPTATSLAAAPAVRAGWVAENGPVIVDAISGVTGAGKSCNCLLYTSHLHFFHTSVGSSPYMLMDMGTSEAALVQHALEFSQDLPDDAWVVTQGWRDYRWDPPEHPTKASLDAAFPDRPCVM